MKDLLKRYRLFLAISLFGLILTFFAPDKGLEAVHLSVDNTLRMLSFLPPFFILLGLLDVWVDRTTLTRHMGRGSGLKGVLVGFLIGSTSAGPLYAAFPLAAVLLNKGASLLNVFIFIGAWGCTKIHMLLIETAALGLRFTLLRLALNIIGICLIALILDRSANKAGIQAPAQDPQ